VARSRTPLVSRRRAPWRELLALDGVARHQHRQGSRRPRARRHVVC